jgi:hypothetical protein
MHHEFTKSRLSSTMTDTEIIRIIGEQLPHWKRACDDKGAEMVIIQQQAFNRSVDDSFLLVVAIRYAGLAGKTVMIAPYES